MKVCCGIAVYRSRHLTPGEEDCSSWVGFMPTKLQSGGNDSELRCELGLLLSYVCAWKVTPQRLYFCSEASSLLVYRQK